jgi:opacity protein-like surface antigen
VIPITPVIVTNDWSGGYVGGQVGFGRLTLEDLSAGNLEDDVNSGALFGVHAGFMSDFGRVVVGAEIDHDRTQIESDYYGVTDRIEPPLQLDSVTRAKLRLGYDAGRVLPYVTAGVARAQFSDEGETEELEDAFDGSFVGLGASFAASENVMVGIEGLRQSFDEAPFFDDNSTLNTVTLRGSFRF